MTKKPLNRKTAKKGVNTKRKKQTKRPNPNSETYNLEEYRQKKQKKQAGNYNVKLNYNRPQQTPPPKAKLRVVEGNNTYSKDKQNPKNPQNAPRRRRKRRFNKAQRDMMISLVGVFLVVFVGVKLAQLYAKPTITYQEVASGMIDNSEIISGIIIRKESVYDSTSTGDVHYVTIEGEKVKKDGAVAVIADNQLISSTQGEIKQLDTDISQVQDKRVDVSDYQQQLYALSDDINTELTKYYKQQDTYTLQNLYSLRDNLDTIIGNKNYIYASDDFQEDWDLQQNRIDLSDKIDSYQNTVVAEVAGTVSYKIDGYEDISLDMDYDTYASLLKEMPDENMQLSASSAVEGEPLFKIIEGYTWEIITYIKTQESLSYIVGEKITITINQKNNMQLTGTITQKTTDEDYTKLVLEVSTNLNDFLSDRKISFSLGDTSAEGLKIPISAIIEKHTLLVPNDYIFMEGGKYGVLQVQNNGTTKFVQVNRQTIGETYTGILQDVNDSSVIQLYDEIKHPETDEIYTVGRIESIQGVYIINDGYANFKKIKIAIDNGEYAILTSDDSTSLKRLDQVITNPKGVEENQLIQNIENK
ncbi:MAG: hypothetical protein ATN35_05050 [Epulopiscium sp. Nele67-Bin004]|nr:MAG: hypothetical protein ATN35_05050 [Epulopiscium sp. Nele67-Bin004]